jgi:cation:H+ antiporter
MVNYWLQFLGCMAVIAFSGFQLSRSGDVIAAKTGLGRTWIGVVLLATVTSLPELISGSSAILWVHAPDLAVGNIFGACLLNLFMLAVADFFHPPGPVLTAAERGQVLAAACAIILLSVATLGVMARSPFANLMLGHISLSTPVLLVCYLVSMRLLFRFQKRERREYLKEHEDELEFAEVDLQAAVIKFTVNAMIVVGAALWLPWVAERLAMGMGWQESFMGTVFVALTTSLPEFAVTISALRIGAVDLAIGDLFGSILCNVGLLAVFDILSFRQPLLLVVSPQHAATGMLAILMAGIAAVELIYRPKKKAMGWLSTGAFFLALLYGFNIVWQILTCGKT